MSFVIALCNGNKEAYLASDTRVTRNDKPVREDFIKIIPKLTFTTTNSVESIQIGFAGIKEIDEIILNKVKEKELCLVKRNAETFAHLIHDEMNEFYNQNNIDKDKFKSMFIVIGKTEKK